MATPTISNNTPSAGHIAWDDFAINYEGISYAVGAASTSEKWVWWNYNGGAPVIEAGSSIPSSLTDDDVVLFTNKDGLGIRVQSTSMVDGELLVDGTILADAIATNQINSQHVVTGGLDAGVIKFGLMSGDRIGVNTLVGDRVVANSIAVSKLMVASMDNLLADPTFEIPTLGASYAWAPDVGLTILEDAGPTGGNVLEMVNGPYLQTAVSLPEDTPIEGGASFRFLGRIRQVSAAIAEDSVQVVIESKDSSGVASGLYISAPATDADTWVDFSGKITLPENAVSYTVSLVSEVANDAGFLQWDYVQLNRAANAELIVDGSITGAQIKAESIIGENLAAASITGVHIQANSIGASQIQAQSITADLFAANMIMATTFTTGVLDEEGDIVGGYSEMGPEGIFTVDEEGSPIASLPIKAGTSSYIKAHMELLSAEVKDNFIMYGTNNSFASGSEVYLNGGIEAPSSPPILREQYFSGGFNQTPGNGWYGLNAPFGEDVLNFPNIIQVAYNPYYDSFTIAERKNGGTRIWNYSSSGGVLIWRSGEHNGKAWVGDYNACEDFSMAYLESNSSSPELLYRFTGNDTYYYGGKSPDGVTRYGKVPDSWYQEAGGRYPILCIDDEGKRYMVQNVGGFNGKIQVREIFPITTNGQEYITSGPVQTFEDNSGSNRQITSASFGYNIAGRTAKTWVFSYSGSKQVRTFNTAGVELKTDGNYYNWELLLIPLGMVYSTSENVWIVFDASGKFNRLSSWVIPSLNSKIWVGYAAVRSGNGLNGFTPVGALGSQTLRRRTWLKVSVPETNDPGIAGTMDKWQIFAGLGTETKPTDPADLFHLSTVGNPNGPTSMFYDRFTGLGFNPPGGIAGQPGAVNTFPDESPAKFKTSKSDVRGPLIVLSGDGSGRTGPISWTTTGEFEFKAGPLNATGSFTGAFNFTRLGEMVFYEGYVDRDDNFTGVATIPGITIPTWARPASTVLTGAQGGYNSTSQYRYRFEPNGTMSVQRTSQMTTFMAMSGVYFVPPFL